MIRKFNDNKKVKSEKFKEMQEDDRLNSILNERKKSANRRELEKYYSDEEEKVIHEQLKVIREKRNKDSWKGDNFNKGVNMLKDDRPILKEKNIFKNNNNMFMGKKTTKQKGGKSRW